MSRSAVRVRSSALLNTFSLRRSTPWGGLSEKSGPASAARVAPRGDHVLMTRALGLLDGQGDEAALMVVSALACLEAQRAAHGPQQIVPRSVHLLVPRALAAPPLASADPLWLGRAGSSYPPDAGPPALALPCDTGGTSYCP